MFVSNLTPYMPASSLEQGGFEPATSFTSHRHHNASVRRSIHVLAIARCYLDCLQACFLFVLVSLGLRRAQDFDKEAKNARAGDATTSDQYHIQF
jgi:hypothetical protein|eukprot:COSAG01_NODE_3748_length_5737_cov_64.443597_1_plen_95_part_00